MRTGVLRLQARRRPSEVLGRHGFHLSGRSLSDLGCDFAGLVRQHCFKHRDGFRGAVPTLTAFLPLVLCWMPLSWCELGLGEETRPCCPCTPPFLVVPHTLESSIGDRLNISTSLTADGDWPAPPIGPFYPAQKVSALTCLKKKALRTWW